MRRRAFLAAAAAALASAGCQPPGAPTFQATDVTGADFGREFHLLGHDGQTRTLADFRGKVVAVFFGFTHCPDVCPTALAKLASASKLLGPDAAKLQVLLVTVDPERDTPAVLGPYVKAFDASFLGLTGSADDIARTAREFRVVVQKQPGASPETYTVDHSSGIFIFDTQGRLRLFANAALGPEALASDVRALLRSG